MSLQEKKFAEMRAIARNQQTSIDNQQKLIDQQHQDLENRARTIENQRIMVETERAKMITENEIMARRFIDQGVHFALETIPFWKKWFSWDLTFLMQRAREIKEAIDAETAKDVKAATEKRELSITNQVTTEITPDRPVLTSGEPEQLPENRHVNEHELVEEEAKEA